MTVLGCRRRTVAIGRYSVFIIIIILLFYQSVNTGDCSLTRLPQLKINSIGKISIT